VSCLQLRPVTLCAATSVNVSATVFALQRCLEQVEFGECILFTDDPAPTHDSRIRVVPVETFPSGAAYSEFILANLADFITTDHCLIVQWDGFILDANQWDPAFLTFDYIGAPWPQFRDGRDVGNGGFSLRSRRLLEACGDPKFKRAHPEDLAICRLNRDLLEGTLGLRFADRATAQRFSVERIQPNGPTFGFHGIFNMVRALGPDRFWQVYRTLDDKGTAFVDYLPIWQQLGEADGALRRRVRLSLDYLAAVVNR
jgi:hypothetical protein